jgi:hypothetical protein
VWSVIQPEGAGVVVSDQPGDAGTPIFPRPLQQPLQPRTNAISLRAEMRLCAASSMSLRNGFATLDTSDRQRRIARYEEALGVPPVRSVS